MIVLAAASIGFVATLPASAQSGLPKKTVKQCQEEAKQTFNNNRGLINCHAPGSPEHSALHQLLGTAILYWEEKCIEKANIDFPPKRKQKHKAHSTGRNITLGPADLPADTGSSSPTKVFAPGLLKSDQGRATSPKGSNTGAMDRLGGDSQLPNSSRPGSIPGEGNRRVPASGGASAVAKPVTNTPPLTIDSGNCANCGRPSAIPR
jgi:hypothetical protein